MKLEVHVTSDVGYARNHNEDMALVGTRLIRDDRYDTVHEVPDGGRTYVLSVADGLGGQSAGEVASREVLNSLREHVAELEPGLAPSTVNTRLSEIADRIQGELLRQAGANERRRGMSTTMTAVVIYESQFYLLHAGDSRCYAFKNGVLKQVSRDHTLREFSGDPRIPGNILVNCFGVEQDFFVDVRQFGSEGESGDLFLLCSDGLTDMVSDERIERTLADAEGVGAAGLRLLELAREGGAQDNITFVLARVS